jgi:hypothetical protein
MFYKEKPDVFDWLNIIKEALFPIVFIIASMMTGIFCSDYKLENIGEYLFLIAVTGTFIALFRDINDGIKNISWFQKQNCRTDKIVVSIWSSFWLKIWLFLGVIAFITGLFL